MSERTMEQTAMSVKHPARTPEPAAHAPVRAPAPVWDAAGAHVPGAPSAVLAIQRAAGNQAVMRMLDAQRPKTGDVIQAVVDDDEEELPAQFRHAGAAAAAAVTEPAPANRTGLPDALKRGVENLSGLSLDDVRVHYNSSAPPRVNALAYAQGTEIHVAPGQERHLPHEAWHVVQQKQGRVKATLDLAGIPVNDAPELEREADAMGPQALGAIQHPMENSISRKYQTSHSIYVAQRLRWPEIRPQSDHAPAVQRAMKLTRTDYNLTAEEFVDFEVEAAGLKQLLSPYLRSNAEAYPDDNAPIGPAVRKVIFNRLQSLTDQVQLEGADVPSLAVALAAHLRQNAALDVNEVGRFQLAVEEAIAACSPAIDADKGGTTFDTMIVNAGTGSRAKGAPTTIHVDAIPARAAVKTIAAAIFKRNERLTTRFEDEFAEILTEHHVAAHAITGFTDIRAVHTNLSGWLPAVAVPEVITLADANARIYDEAPQSVRKALLKTGKMPTHRRRLAYTATVERAVLSKLSKRNRIIFFWSNYSHMLEQPSPYVEFNVSGGDLSRLCYDYVNGRFYVSVHYKGHKGFNPFFDVNGLQDS